MDGVDLGADFVGYRNHLYRLLHYCFYLGVPAEEERQKLMFRVKARIPPELLAQHLEYVKTGLPGMAYVRLDKQQPWPEALAVRLPQ